MNLSDWWELLKSLFECDTSHFLIGSPTSNVRFEVKYRVPKLYFFAFRETLFKKTIKKKIGIKGLTYCYDYEMKVCGY